MYLYVHVCSINGQCKGALGREIQLRKTEEQNARALKTRGGGSRRGITVMIISNNDMGAIGYIYGIL